jgi:hypothetical protein
MRHALLGLALISLAPAAQAAPRTGFVTYDVRDVATNQPIPCKLTFVGEKGTPTPAFTKNDIGRQEGDAVAAFNRLMSATGQGEIALPTGSYSIWVSRGPEWDAQVIRGLRIGAVPVAVKTKLAHVIDSRGWLAGDFHVHAAASPDSQVPMQDRVYEFVADGVELIVSTDHNVVADYEPIIRQLGLGKYLASLPGDELTTGGWGHFGAFPLQRDLERAGQGAVLVHGKNAADFFADVRRVAPLAIIDVHHPRIDEEIGYFNLTRYDAREDRADKVGFSIDFDALEVLNGYQDAERKHVDRVIEDWFALLDHGHLVTATGNSDTHHLDHNIGGYPRNYVEVLNDEPALLRPEDVARAVRGHHTFFTTAPFVRVRTGGATIGDLAPAHDGKADLEIEVDAAPWVTVSTVSVYVDGRLNDTIKVPVSKNPVRLHTTVPLSFTRDAYAVVRVDGDEPLAPIVGDLTRFDVRPLALTNPIFFDVDGNGRFDARLARPRR